MLTCLSSEFQPMKYNHYKGTVAFNALLWVTALIGIIALTTTALSVGNTAAFCMIGAGSSAALLLTLYLIRDRRKEFMISINGHKISTCAASSIAYLRSRAYVRGIAGENISFYVENQCLDENSSVGSYNLQPQMQIAAR